MSSKLPNFAGEKLVCLRVGSKDNITTFHVHANVITKVSPVFKAAFEGPWAENECKTYDFKEEVTDSDTVNRFLQFAYKGRTEIDDNDGEEAHYLQRFQLYIFADKYRVVGLMNSMIEILCKKTPTMRTNNKPVLPSPEAVQLAYLESPAGSPLRKIVLSIFLYHNNARDYFLETWGQELLEDCPDFTLDVARNLLQDCSLSTKDCKHCNASKYFMVSEDDKKAGSK